MMANKCKQIIHSLYIVLKLKISINLLIILRSELFKNLTLANIYIDKTFLTSFINKLTVVAFSTQITFFDA